MTTSARERGLGALVVSAILAVLVAIVSMGFGRLFIPPTDVVTVLGNNLFGDGTLLPEYQATVMQVRFPRVLLAMTIGAGLAGAGVALQAIFANPIVSPQVLGASSGASVGGALAIVLGLGQAALVAFSFVAGLLALGFVFAMSRTQGRNSLLSIVLSGIIVGTFCSAVVSLLKYVADPYDQLPTIVFWLLGTLASATYTKLWVALIPVVLGFTVILMLRWRVNLLSLGDDEARALGVNPQRVRWVLLIAVALIVAGAVAVSGVIGWVGLVVPHLGRLLVGSDNQVLTPVAVCIGAGYLTLIDTITRSAGPAEIPLGVLTALVGAPVFFLILRSSRNRGWAG
ncbi:MAG: iron ABC transporter permease [Propionibacteriaceae bacterium]|nr:iron ABC transporter permease [Propionibacteriaceae bacterium]